MGLGAYGATAPVSPSASVLPVPLPLQSSSLLPLDDDIKRGQCTRCHKGGRIRKTCKEPPAKWEDKFDKEKGQYWESVLKWQAKATSNPKPSPTLHE